MNLALVKVQGEGSIMKSNFVVGTKSNLLQKNDIKIQEIVTQTERNFVLLNRMFSNRTSLTPKKGLFSR